MSTGRLSQLTGGGWRADALEEASHESHRSMSAELQDRTSTIK